jgi:hypothetical protein
VKPNLYEELERVFDKFRKHHKKILLGDFNAKVGREEILKLTTGNESLHDISNDNGVTLVNFITSKNLRVKSTMFPHRNIQNPQTDFISFLVETPFNLQSVCIHSANWCGDWVL